MKSKKQSSLLVVIGIIFFCLITFFSEPSNQKALAEFLGLEEKEESYSTLNNSETQKNLEKVFVDRVVDGDTVVLDDGRKVRYLNIDTAETVKPNTPVQCYGSEASKMNEALVEGKTVYILIDENPTDIYGRYLRFVFLEGKNTTDISQSVNAYLVKMGYARASIYKDNDTYADIFYQLEREAKEKNLGIWGACPNPFEE